MPQWIRGCALSLLIALPAAALVGTAPAQADAATTSSVTMAGDGIDPRVWYAGSGEITVSGSVDDQVLVHVSGGASGDSFDLTFAAPYGQSLTVGQYGNAVRTPFRTTTEPGIEILGPRISCNRVTGRFTVIDIAPDLSRLALRYEHHCEGGDDSRFGEIRVNEPVADADLLTVPTSVAWPEEFPGVAGVSVPVTLVNAGQSPVTISELSTDVSDFSVLGHDCTRLEVAATCVVTMRFRPTTGGTRTGTLTVEDSTAVGVHRIDLIGTGISGHTSMTLRSQAGDVVGGGEDFSFTPTNATMRSSAYPKYMSVAAGRWQVVFTPGGRRDFVAGETYADVERYPGDDTLRPSLIASRGSACGSSITGSFTVHEAEFDSEGVPTKFSATFEQHCEGAGPALFGSVAWMADEPARALPPRFSLTSSKAIYGYAKLARITAHVSSDAPTRGVSIYATPRGGVRRLVARGNVDASGNLTTAVKVVRRTTFTATYNGEGVVPDVSASRVVRVTARVRTTMKSFMRKSGKFYLYKVTGRAVARGRISPNHAGDCAYIQAQFRVHGRWSNSSSTGCLTLSRTSRASAFLKGKAAYLGVPIRFQTVWAGDVESVEASSPWRYAKFVR